MERRNDYVYLQLKDAITCIGQKVNLAAVVVDFELPKRSKGTDYFCMITISDTSYEASGLSVNFFVENETKLPHVKSARDIIYLHHVLMKIVNRKVYAAFDKRYSSFALFEGSPGGATEPYQVSPKFDTRVLDKELLAQLRTCFFDNQLDTEVDKRLLLFREIKAGEPLDLVCKIICAQELTEDRWMLFVWDGTDAPPIGLPMKLDEVANPLPLLLEPSPLPRDVLRRFPRVGTALRVIIAKKLGLQVQGGEWIKLRNITCEVKSGLWLGVFSPASSRLQVLSTEDKFVRCLQRFHKERISSRLDRMPFWSFPWPSRITETDCELSFSTLMDLLTHSKVPHKYKCVVRVLAVYPSQAELFRSAVTQVYRLRLTLEDPTARIHSFIYDEDGVEFFEGYQPADVLTVRMNKLLGIAEGTGNEEVRNPPWVQLCLKSYYLDQNDTWGTRHYRIFGTRLVG